MSQQNSTPETPRKRNSEWLANLISRAFWPIKGYLKTLEGDNVEIPSQYVDLLAVLVPLVDRLESDLMIINDVLERSFGGMIKVETYGHLKEFKAYDLKDFRQAYVGKLRLKLLDGVDPAISPSEDLESPESH